MNGDDTGEWLSVQEAAAKLGTTEGGIRSRITRQTLRHRKGNDGKLTVFVPVDAADDRRPDGDDTAFRLLLERDNALAQAEHWRSQAEAAKLDAAGARAERDAAKAIAAAEVAAKDALIGELRAMLTDARRPFWRRWLRP